MVTLLETPKPIFEGQPLREKHAALATKAKEILDEYRGKRDFTIIDLAKELDSNETTLKQAFKKKYGTTIWSYFNDRRMKHAMKDLHAGKSVAETAMLAGYATIAHFSTSFRKHFGILPSSIQ
ncbi:AraC family transcriptional regulator [Chitinophaga sp. YR627]|uniref:helix-turn-helix transcriptional regulator n=1 Tax=Chitinophaga sp. YR627 TaxID=1881041 RepID=UPI0008EEFE09|nr:helix-turn-helix transcriptional regulator [Chitinophaga sp. YR627]SFM88748.1 AraC family transcriptional regulator [Chitinophaga sp. YR627]